MNASQSKIQALRTGVGLSLAGILSSLVIVVVLFRGVRILELTLPSAVLYLLALTLNQYLAFGGVALVYLRYRGESLSSIGLRVPTGYEFVIVILGWVTSVVSVIASSILVLLLNIQTAPNDAAEFGATMPRFLILLIPAAFLVIGPSEELLFRGTIQRRFRDAFSAPTAIGLAAALFAVLHYVALNGTVSARLTTIPALLLPSLVFGVAYEHTNNIAVPALIHGAYDATLFTLLYYIVTT